MKATFDIKVVTPTVPNFIRTPYGAVSIADVSDTLLKAIAKEWGKQLVAKAQEKRKQK